MKTTASLFILIVILQTLSASRLASSLDREIEEIEFAVESDSTDSVLEFCKGSGCSFHGQVTSKYFHVKCKQKKVLGFGGEHKMEEIAKKFQIKSLQRPQLQEHYLRTNDPGWSMMWNINGDIQPNTRVVEAWKNGYNGSGITVAVVDDGIQVNHPDLIRNIDVGNSYNYINQDSEITPSNTTERHGTEIAGLIAAEANNSWCIVGVAYASRIIGIRVIENGEKISDIKIAKALRHHLQGVDVYSNSWGPRDGYGYKKPGPVTESAIKDGITLGRNGKGSIYVFAAGNGGLNDNCNADGYVSSIYTIPITSIGIEKKAAAYAEVCAPVFAATYSGSKQRNLTSTSLNSRCVGNLEGTSFSAPQASAIIALTLQANPSLTWRDVQHLIVQTSDRHHLDDGFDKQSWQRNGAGFQVSQIIGFGLMNAEAMVQRAKTWTLVDPQHSCSSQKKYANQKLDMSSLNYITFLLQVTSSLLQKGNVCPISSLEHVQVEVSIKYGSKRGSITLILESPSGTKSYLMTQRPLDSALTSYSPGHLLWTFTSVHFWGEDIEGHWKLTMEKDYDFDYIVDSSVTLVSWTLHFYGPTKELYTTYHTHKVTETPGQTTVYVVPKVPWANTNIHVHVHGKDNTNPSSSTGHSTTIIAVAVVASLIGVFLVAVAALYVRRAIIKRRVLSSATAVDLTATQTISYDRF